MSKMNVPIYTADITVEVTDNTKGHKQSPEKIFLENQVVKGFNITQIKSRMARKLFDKILTTKKNRATKSIKVINIRLLRQHGYGIED